MRRDRLSAVGKRFVALSDGARRLISLPRPEQRLSVEAALILVRVAARMRMLGWKSAMRPYRSPVRHPRTPQATDLAEARALHLALLRASRVLGIGTCLSRSLALQQALARRGVRGDLRIGVRGGAEGINAHAWIEVAGTPCAGGLNAYQALRRLSRTDGRSSQCRSWIDATSPRE